MPLNTDTSGPAAWQNRRHTRLRRMLIVVLALFVFVRFFDATIVRLAYNPHYHRSGLHTVLWSLGRMETWALFCVVALLCVNRFADSVGREVAYRLRAIIVGALISAAMAGVIAELLKRLVGRTRPVIETGGFDVITRYKPFLRSFLDDSNLGFPSSHAAVIAGASLLVAAQVPRAAAWAVVVIALVSYQRLAQSAHFPTDILGGVLIGAFCAAYVNNRVDALAPVDDTR